MARLEATVDAFVTTVRSQFDNTSDQFEVLYKHIDGLRDAIQQRDRTPWANYLSALALLFVVIGFGAQGYIRDLSRIERDVEVLDRNVEDHLINGHKASTESIESIKDWIRRHDDRAITRGMHDETQ